MEITLLSCCHGCSRYQMQTWRGQSLAWDHFELKNDHVCRKHCEAVSIQHDNDPNDVQHEQCNVTRDCWQKWQDGFWCVQVFTVCSDSAKCCKTDKTALYSTDGKWPVTLCECKPRASQSTEMNFLQRPSQPNDLSPVGKCIVFIQSSPGPTQTALQHKSEFTHQLQLSFT